MRTFKLTIAYDGTAYAGWQRQNGIDTVQGHLEAALGEIEGHAVPIHGAGRTDTGVHALGQVASFKLRHTIESSVLLRALNAKLPRDIRALHAEVTVESFHARYGVCSKAYRYQINRAPVANPIERRFAWHVPEVLDLATMNQAGALLVGEHDFAAFQTATSPEAARSTVRTVFDLCVRSKNDEMIMVDITGNGFLRYMVRTIVGTLVQIGLGRYPVSEMADILGSLTRDRAGPTAPPHGLFLVSVDYPDA